MIDGPTIAPTIYPLFLIQTSQFCISLPPDLERGGLRSPIGHCDSILAPRAPDRPQTELRGGLGATLKPGVSEVD